MLRVGELRLPGYHVVRVIWPSFGGGEAIALSDGDFPSRHCVAGGSDGR